MASILVLYKTPKDPAAFDRYYVETHIPIAERLPGLQKYEISKGKVVTPAGPSGVHLVANLVFDDLASIQQAFASPEGQDAGADVQKFSTGGTDILIFDSREV